MLAQSARIVCARRSEEDPSEKGATMVERRGFGSGGDLDGGGVVDAAQTPVVQVMGEGIQDSAVEPQGGLHEGWAVQPQSWGASDDDSRREGASGQAAFPPSFDASRGPSHSDSFPQDGPSWNGSWQLGASPADRSSRQAPDAGGAPLGSPGHPDCSAAAKAGVKPLVLGVLSVITVGIPAVSIIAGVFAVATSIGVIKRFGKNGKAIAGRVCGIAGIALSVVIIAVGVLGSAMLTTHVSDFVSPSDGGFHVSGLFDEDNSSEYYMGVDADDRAAEEAVRVELDKFAAGDPALAEWLAAEIDEMFSLSGYAFSDIGVDPRAVADWLMADFSYEMDSAYTFSDGTGTVYADLEVRDVFELFGEFGDASQDMIDSGQLHGMDEATALGQLGQAFVAAMDATANSHVDFFAAFDVVEEDGVWTVDQASWEEEIAIAFGLY